MGILSRPLYAGIPADNHADMVRRRTGATGDRNGAHTHPERVVRGESHHRHLHPDETKGKRWPRVLTYSDIPVIRAAYAEGESQAAIARRYGVTRATINLIMTGKNWAWA